MSHVYLLPRRWIRLSCWIGHNFYSRWVLKLRLKIWILCLLCRVLFLAAFRACCCRYFHIPPLKRLSPGFYTEKNFPSHGGVCVGEIYGSIRGTCLRWGRPSRGISCKIGGKRVWNKIQYQVGQWAKIWGISYFQRYNIHTMILLPVPRRKLTRIHDIVTRMLRQHNVLKSCWWRRGKRNVGRTVRDAETKRLNFKNKHTITWH